MPVTAPVHLDGGPKPVIARKISCGNRARIGFRRSSHQEGVTGVIRGDSFDAQDLRSIGLDRRVNNPDALIGRIDPDKDQRRTGLHDQDGRQNHRRDIDDVPLDGLSFKPGALGGATIQGDREPPVEDRKAAKQRLATYGPSVIGSQIGQRSGEGIQP